MYVRISRSYLEFRNIIQKGAQLGMAPRSGYLCNRFIFVDVNDMIVSFICQMHQHIQFACEIQTRNLFADHISIPI